LVLLKKDPSYAANQGKARGGVKILLKKGEKRSFYKTCNLDLQNQGEGIMIRRPMNEKDREVLVKRGCKKPGERGLKKTERQRGEKQQRMGWKFGGKV